MPVNVSGVDGWTALHLRAYGNRTDFVKCLLQVEDDINKQDESGNTALHRAARTTLMLPDCCWLGVWILTWKTETMKQLLRAMILTNFSKTI